jgi:hypothetical protein
MPVIVCSCNIMVRACPTGDSVEKRRGGETREGLLIGPPPVSISNGAQQLKY